MEATKAKMKSVWLAGDFGKIALLLETGADEFIERLNLQKGERVLDVACGSDNLAIPAAENLECRFDEGDAAQMPYADASFDTVITMFSAMLAPNLEVATSELVRNINTQNFPTFFY